MFFLLTLYAGTQGLLAAKGPGVCGYTCGPKVLHIYMLQRRQVQGLQNRQGVYGFKDDNAAGLRGRAKHFSHALQIQDFGIEFALIFVNEEISVNCRDVKEYRELSSCVGLADPVEAVKCDNTSTLRLLDGSQIVAESLCALVNRGTGAHLVHDA
jgi:hypothetical protein